MSQQFNESTTPSVHDTKWRIRAKILKQARANLSDSNAATAPLYGDTRRKQMDKIEKVFSGNG